MSTRKWAPVLLPFTVGLLGSYLDWSQFGAVASWGEVLASRLLYPDRNRRYQPGAPGGGYRFAGGRRRHTV